MRGRDSSGARGLPGAAFDAEVEDARREVHRAGEHAREEEDRLVLGRIAALAAPRVVLLPARAFALIMFG